MDITFMILATLVAVEHIYIMWLETIFTKSRITARTFNMDVEELSRPSVSTLFKNYCCPVTFSTYKVKG